VVLCVAVAIVAMIALGRGRQRQTGRHWASGNAQAIRTWRGQPGAAIVSVYIWAVLIAGVISWDLASFILGSPLFPTLSYFIGHVTRHRVGRGFFFFLWLVAGSYLATAWRTPTSP